MKPSNWDPCLRMGTRGLGRGQKLSASGRDSCQAEGRVSLKDDLIVHLSKWNAMEKGIQYLRASTVLEVICRDSNKEQSSEESGEVQCTQSMWWEFVQSTPSSHISPFTWMSMKEGEEPVLQVLKHWLWQYEDSFLPISLHLSSEKTVQDLKD